MRHGQRIAVVIPALNEAQAIGHVLEALPDWLDHVVVADNGSADRTAKIAADKGATVVREPRRGYGSACLAGVAGVPQPVDILVFLDADFSDRPEQMNRLVDPIIDGRADLVIGARQPPAEGETGTTLQQRLGNALACFLIARIWRHRYTDLGPFRAVRRSSYDALEMADRDYGWTIEMQIKALEGGLRVLEVPVCCRPRIGTSKISGTVTGVVRAGTKILSVIAVFSFRRQFGMRKTRAPSRQTPGRLRNRHSQG
ncbi:MAG: glycosyltransferase family 2 protein [Alphaproteobacteria bacterium]